MEQSTAHFWHAYHSQIYTTLRRLEDEGLLISVVEGDDDRLNRRVYTITEAGRADLRAWLDVPLSESPPVKEELLVRLFFSGGRDRRAVIDELRFQKQLHQHKLTEYQNLAAGHLLAQFENMSDGKLLTREVPFWVATLRFGIAFEQMYLAWLDQTIAALEE
jgi:DNA-binding PadR family transcriptional regulator